MFCFEKTYSIKNIQDSLKEYEKENGLKLNFVETKLFLTILMENGSECIKFKAVPGHLEKIFKLTFFDLISNYNDGMIKKEEHKSKIELNGSPSTDDSLNEKKNEKKLRRKKNIRKIKKKISFLKTKINKSNKEKGLTKFDERQNATEIRGDNSQDFLEKGNTNKNIEEEPVYFFYMNFY